MALTAQLLVAKEPHAGRAPSVADQGEGVMGGSFMQAGGGLRGFIPHAKAAFQEQAPLSWLSACSQFPEP